MADARTRKRRPEFGPEFAPQHKVQASPKLRRTVARVLHWFSAILAGYLLWFAGMRALNVPPDLPVWRIMAGASLIVAAVVLWWGGWSALWNGQRRTAAME